MSLTAKVSLSLIIDHSKTLSLSTVSDQFHLSRGVTLSDSTPEKMADVLWHANRTLADGTNETLDLQDGTLSDVFGDAVTLTRLKAVYIRNNSSDASLLIGGAAATQLGLFNDVTDILKLPPGGEFLMTAPDSNGIDVTTNSDLKLAHDGTGISSLDYDIMVIGVD